MPKSILFYLLFFLTALGGWLGMLALYCKNDYIAQLIAKESLPFLDLNRDGSIAQWFISFLWLVITVHSFLMIFFVIGRSRREAFDQLIREVQGKVVNRFPRYNATTRILFWMGICLLSFLMSADTICRFSPILQGCLAEMGRSGAETNGGKISLLIVGTVIGGLMIGFLMVQTFWRYIISIHKSRFILYPAFFLTFLILIFAVSCRCLVPESDTAAALEQKTESEESGESSDKKESAYLKVAYSKPSNSEEEEYQQEETASEPVTWESILGLDQTLETKLGMDKTMEESFKLNKSTEAYLFDQLPELSVQQVRTILRRGLYGIFLVFFSTSLGLLARSERILFDKRVAQQAMQLSQGYDETCRLWKNRRRYGSGSYDD